MLYFEVCEDAEGPSEEAELGTACKMGKLRQSPHILNGKNDIHWVLSVPSPITPFAMISFKNPFWYLTATKFRGKTFVFIYCEYLFRSKCFSCFTETYTFPVYKFLPLEVWVPFVTVFKNKYVINLLLLSEQTLLWPISQMWSTINKPSYTE